MTSLRKILFIRPIWASNSSFAEGDYEIMARRYKLTKMSFVENDKLFPLRVLKHLRRHDLCYVWFGGVHAFWALCAARVLGKKVVVVAGGYDAVHIPEIGYGLKYENKGWRRACFAFRHADRVLAVSEWLKNNVERLSGVTNPVKVVYNAVETSFPLQLSKETKVLTVSNMTWNRFKVKGIEIFMKVASAMKDVSFILVGGGDKDVMSHLRSIASPNVHFTGQLPHDQVLEMMSRCKVYAQLSYVESFGCALAEAMSCECIPVVTDRGAIPEIAGPEGLYVGYGDIERTVRMIRQALTVNSGTKYRKRIVELFSVEKREKALCEVIDSLLS